MTAEIDQEEIINRITTEVLKEVQESNIQLTEKEIKQKIDSKLNDAFNNFQNKKDIEKKKNDDEINNFIENQFSNIDDTDEKNSNDEFLNSNIAESLSDFEEKKDHEINNDSLNLSDISDSEENVEKKKFFQELADVYKEEFRDSIDCFKNSLESFKLMAKTSIVEKIVIFIFLVIPAIFGGLLTLFFVAILFLLWQLYLIIRVFLRFFERIENSIKSNISKIKKKITDMKNGGGFFNRLLFSNLLYSLIMFNGILYMMVKGLMIPLKSVAEIDKILANLIAKVVKGVSIILRLPSEMAIKSLGANAIKSSKTKEKQTSKGKQPLKLKDLVKAKGALGKSSQNLNNAKAKAQLLPIKNSMTQSIANKVNEHMLKGKINNLANNEIIQTPSSSMLSQSEKNRSNINDLGGLIYGNLMNKLNQNNSILDDKSTNRNFSDNFKSLSGLKDNNDSLKIERDIKEGKQEVNQDIKEASNKLQQEGYSDINELSNIYDNFKANNSENPTLDVLEHMNPDFKNKSQDEKLDIAMNLGSIREAKEDIQDYRVFEEWHDNNPDASMKEYLNFKALDAKEDLNKETEEFKERYGINCNELLEKGMKETNIDSSKVMNDEEFSNAAKAAIKDFPEDKQIGMMKDLREHNLSYREYQESKSERDNYKENNAEKATNFRDNENSKQQNNDRSGGISL